MNEKKMYMENHIKMMMALSNKENWKPDIIKIVEETGLKYPYVYNFVQRYMETTNIKKIEFDKKE